MDDPKVVTFNEPSGWQLIDLRDFESQRPIRAFVVQIQILQNHQNGRDTHIRSDLFHFPLIIISYFLIVFFVNNSILVECES